MLNFIAMVAVNLRETFTIKCGAKLTGTTNVLQSKNPLLIAAMSVNQYSHIALSVRQRGKRQSKTKVKLFKMTRRTRRTPMRTRTFMRPKTTRRTTRTFMRTTRTPMRTTRTLMRTVRMKRWNETYSLPSDSSPVAFVFFVFKVLYTFSKSLC